MPPPSPPPKPPPPKKQSRGADPSIPSDDFDPYLDPGPKLPRDLAADDCTRAKIDALERRYGGGDAASGRGKSGGGGGGAAGAAASFAVSAVAPRPHRHLGDFWTLYDHGPDAVLQWPADGEAPPESAGGSYPEERRRARDAQLRREARAARRAARDAALAGGGGVAAAANAFAAANANATPPPTPPAVYLFPGQGSQQAGKMLSAAAAARLPAVREMLRTAERVLGYDVLALVGGGGEGGGGGAGGAGGEGGAGAATAAVAGAASPAPSPSPLMLDDTRYAQPALFVAGMAALEALKAKQQQEQQEQQGQQQQPPPSSSPPSSPPPRAAPPPPPPTAMAGLSLGEYCALCAAGALSFEDALRVVKARGEAMAAAASDSGGRPHGMLSVVGLRDGALEALVAESRAEAEAAAAAAEAGGGDGDGNTTPRTVLEVANFLFPEGRVVSGHVDALDLLEKKAQAAGALKASRLQVAGAFHTRLMQPAAEALRAALDAADVRPLAGAGGGGAAAAVVISNVTGEPFPVADAEAVKRLLCRQLVEPVQWEATLKRVLALGVGGGGGGRGGSEASGVQQQPTRAPVRLYELGPGAQLKAMVRRLDTPAWKAMVNVTAL
jgi:[acyl-carrier-protein] S-malonyltransferase